MRFSLGQVTAGGILAAMLTTSSSLGLEVLWVVPIVELRESQWESRGVPVPVIFFSGHMHLEIS